MIDQFLRWVPVAAAASYYLLPAHPLADQVLVGSAWARAIVLSFQR